MNWKTLFLSLHGRIERKAFWLGLGLVLAATLVVRQIPVAGGWLWLAGGYGFLAVFVKRLHDLNRSGWLALIPLALAAVLVDVVALTLASGMLVGSSASLGAKGIAWLGGAVSVLAAVIAVTVAFLIWVGGTVGKPQINSHGPAAN